MANAGTAMRTVLVLGVFVVCCCGVAAAYDQADMDRALDETIKQATTEAAEGPKGLKATQFEGIENVAVLPLWGEGNRAYIAGMLKSAMIGGSYKIMERNTEAWDSLLSEIKWDTLREDIMNPATIQGFGKIEGCDAVIYGRVRECKAYPGKGLALTRLVLYLGDVETGEVLWSSAEIQKSVTLTDVGPGVPPIQLDASLVRAINIVVQEAAASLNSASLGIKSFAVLPLWGEDTDRYVTDVVQSQLSNSPYNAVPTSTDEWQAHLNKVKWLSWSAGRMNIEAVLELARAKGCDAVLYGTVHERRISDDQYKGVVRMTLFMASAKDGEIIWSPPEELTASVWRDWPDILRVAAKDPIVWVICGVIILLIVWRAFKKLFMSATRPR